jgi:hypothetical protein
MTMRHITFLLYFASLNLLGQKQPAVEEQLIVHINGDSFLCGEYMNYSVLNFSNENNLSRFSKVAYIELIDVEGISRLKSKVILIKGVGSGKLFLPSTLSTGLYTMIIYTPWILSRNMNGLFVKRIAIVNSLQPVPLTSKAISKIKAPLPQNIQTPALKIEQLKNRYSVRESANVSFSSENEGFASISIRQLSPTTYFTLDSLPIELPVIEKELNGVLPDYRGEVIRGKLNFNGNSEKTLRPVFLSVPTRKNYIRVSQSDSKGNFFFVGDDLDDRDEIWLTIESADNSSIEFNDGFLGHHLSFEKPPHIFIDSSSINHITDRSIQVQIENAYFTSATIEDSSSRIESTYGQPSVVYRLDDYTRFNTLEETIIEILLEVSVRKSKGKRSIRIKDGTLNSKKSRESLILLNGFPIMDHEVIFKYDASAIERIEIIPFPYVFGEFGINGIVNFVSNERLIIEDIEGQKNVRLRNVGAQNAEALPVVKPLNSNTPDFRNQLYWSPFFQVTPGEKINLDFVCSDVTGKFEITIMVVLNNGKKIVTTETFEVQ